VLLQLAVTFGEGDSELLILAFAENEGETGLLLIDLLGLWDWVWLALKLRD